MKEYHYIDAAGQQCGPFPLHELREYPIAKTTMVWTSGMTDWVEAQTINELKFLFEGAAQQPASTTPSNSTPSQTNGYGQSYQQASQNNSRGVLDGAMPMPKNWLVESILLCLCCCLPFGIAGIVNASKVETLYRFGDYEEALRVSKEAKKWFLVGLIVGLVGWGLYFGFYALGMLAAFGNDLF